MCGIIGYVGDRNAVSVLLNGLEKLEYRGYDSCGIATVRENTLQLFKTINRIDSLERCTLSACSSGIGLGHTRWATHGGVSEDNAHPHTDEKKRFAVVHNGIIENYLELKENLKKDGYSFYSETDTEVIPNLISQNYKGNLLKAVKDTCDKLKGSFAICVFDVKNPEEIIATRRNSPLLVGVGKDENFVASDYHALLKYTNKIGILENNEMVKISKNEINFFDNDLNEIEGNIKSIEITDDDLGKGAYEHYMLKEINENPITVKNTLTKYVKDGEIHFNFNISKEDIKNIKHIHIVACGTAMHAGLNGKYLLEKLTRIPVNVEVASEFRYKNPILGKDDLVIFISQSGETADTLASLELVREMKIKHLSIINVRESTMDRMSENSIYTKAGIEVAVASTKAYIAQVTLIDLIAIYFAKILNSYNKDYLNKMIEELMKLPNKMEEVLARDSLYAHYANAITDARDIFYLGRGLDYYIALEGSLKLKEISYIHSEAVQFGELKHGPIALIEDGTPAICLCTSNDLMEKVISNIKEIKARGAKVFAITNLGNFPNEVADELIPIPNTMEEFAPLLAMVPLQLIAYHVTVNKNLDVDKPRNLAKSVTVE